MNEEDIKNLSEIIELCEEEINNNDENVSAILDLTDLKSLRNLIKEYKNLKEIEESHRQENGELRERVKQLEEENEDLKNIANNKQWISPCYVAQNYISKSKIKEKIEELDNMMDKINKGTPQKYTVGEISLMKKIYKDLLEKRK